MFGLFKSKNQNNVDRLKAEFDSMVAQIRAADPGKQGLVGRGIEAAEESFRRTYSKQSFQSEPFEKQMKQIDFIRAMEVQINKSDGPIRIMAIGYGLFNRWLAAVMSSDTALIQHVEQQLGYFKKVASSFSDGRDKQV
jgi:hypothetical protein